MKKETRKKVFNFALSGAIVASVATPLAIVLGKESNLLFLNKNTKQTTSNSQFIGSSYINESDYTLDLNHALGNASSNNSNRTISVGTPNIVKSIPQGYIVVSGNSSNKNQQVVCLDKNDPTQELWQLDLGNNNSNENINIYGVEYTPYNGGRLVVLYSQDANDSGYKENNEIKCKVFDFNTNKTPNLSFDFSGWNYSSNGKNESNQSNRQGGRLDTWAITPILNNNSPVTKYLIYCKEWYFDKHDDNGRTRFFLIDVTKTQEQNAKEKSSLRIMWDKSFETNEQFYDLHSMAILSSAAFEENNNVYFIPLIIDFHEHKLEVGLYKVDSSGDKDRAFGLVGRNSHHQINNGITINTNINSPNEAADLVKSSISSSTFKIENNKLKIAFAINMSPNGDENVVSPHRAGKLITLEIGNNNDFNIQIKRLFQGNQSNDNLESKDELWHGYFANEAIIKHGINSTRNNDLTPFISMGWSEEKLNSNPWFVGAIKNPFSTTTTNYSFDTNKTNNPEEFRVYRVNGGNNYDSQNGIYSGSFPTSSHHQFGYNQFNIGLPILEYNDETTNNNVFERNILFTWNKQQKAIVINQKNRQDTINGSPTYGYHTRIETNINSNYHEFDRSIFNNLISNDDMNQVSIDTIKTSILNEIKSKYLKNVVGNENNVSIVENSIKFNFPEGKIEFKINVGNKWFNEKGILQTTDKVFDIAIKGFASKTTNLTNTNIKLYGLGSGNYNNGLAKSAYTFIPTQVASYNVNSSLQDTKRFFTIIFKELVLNNFKKQPNNFRNLSSFSDNTTTDQINQEFKNIFPNFQWIEANNEEGTIKVRLEIDKKYVYTNETNYTIDITFSGLRKIKKTELKNVESSSPLNLNLFDYNIPNDGNSLSGNTYPNANVKLLTEDILKQNIINEINKEYSGINKNNGLDSGEGTLTRHLPFTQKFIDQNGQLDDNVTSYKLSKEHIKLSNFDFFAGYGVLKLDVKLLVWNEGGAHGQLKNTITVDSQSPNASEIDAPSATWYISGFKKDNVVTKFNSDEVWALEGLEIIRIDEFEQYRETVEKSLSDYLKANPHLIDFPYWVNKDEILNNIQVDFDSTNIEIDTQNPKQATLKVRLKDNMWESNDQGKVEDKKTNATYQNIKISGFLNPTPIKLNLETLKTITLSGNTKNIQITNEAPAFTGIEEDKKQYLEIQYSVEGLNQWFTKDAFISKLNELDGSLNNENWIIKREDIQARYALKEKYDNGKVFIEIDGEVFGSNKDITKKISIISDTNNQDVKGYINIDKITEQFKAENFEVRGTDKNPKLIIKNVDELNTLFSRYSSDNIFEILYSDKANETSFDSSKVIWKNGNLSASVNLTGTFTDQFSLSFRGTSNSNYEVYSNGTKQDNGYILTTPGIKMIISIEIDNPFKDKYVKFNFKKNEQNTTDQYFYQNEGGFSVKIGTSQQTSDFKDFSNFINSLSSLDQDKKDSLELAYFVSDHQLTDEQLKQSLEDSFLYEESVDPSQKYNVWKVLNTTNPQENLGLLVNDYVIVTVRVKKDKLSSEEKSGYKINYDGNYVPFQSRVYGYKIKTSEIEIDKKSIQLVNVGQAESAPYALDGYARLKHLSLVEDASKNYLGAAIKINYFNEFYKDQNGKILTSGSGQVLVKRENGTSSKEYKDKDGNPIKDVNNNANILLQLNQNGTPTNLIKGNSTTNLELNQYSLNAFKFPDIEKTELKYNFFQNQTIEFEFVNKKGLATGQDEYDYYVDQPNVKVEYTFNNIKFPISNEKNISYEFNAQEFVEKISNPINRDTVYKNALDPNESPINGQSKLVETFKVIRRENNQNETTLTTLEQINEQIKTDFSGQVKLVATYTSTDGQIKQIDGGDIFGIETLKNGDRFKIEIVSSSDELIFAQLPNPLIFVVSGLFEKDIEQELLKHLRVKQGGVIDGQGSFNILVDDPNQSNSNSDLKTSLGGYKFLVRVWNEDKQIKHEWTENFISINDLNNGDKVEWKLVSPNGSPLKEAYYNTIANPTKHNAAEDKYSFIKVNQEGFAGKNISEPQEGIGQNPEQLNAYPEDSGLLISGLKSRDDSSYTTIEDSEFRRVMNLMNFSYAGINGSGNMISSTSASDIKLNVLGRSSDAFTLDYLIKNGCVTFYYNNESLSQMNSFNWNQVKDENGNWLTSPGTLSNGDSVAIRYKDPISEYWYYAPVVSGLQNKSDGMSMLSWVGIGAAAFVTLGIFAFIYLYVRNKKLK